jgi:hypothetical protein
MKEKTNFWEKNVFFQCSIKVLMNSFKCSNFQRNVQEPGSHGLRLFSCVVWWSVHRLVWWPCGQVAGWPLGQVDDLKIMQNQSSLARASAELLNYAVVL